VGRPGGRPRPQGTVFCRSWWLAAAAPRAARCCSCAEGAAWRRACRCSPPGRGPFGPRGAVPRERAPARAPPTERPLRHPALHRAGVAGRPGGGAAGRGAGRAGLAPQPHPLAAVSLGGLLSRRRATPTSCPICADLAKRFLPSRAPTSAPMCRKAQRQGVRVEADPPTCDRFLRLSRLTFERQGLGWPLRQRSRCTRLLDHRPATRGAAEVLIAVGPDGVDQAGAVLAFDARMTWYLVGGGDPDQRNSGATSLLLVDGHRARSRPRHGLRLRGQPDSRRSSASFGRLGPMPGALPAGVCRPPAAGPQGRGGAGAAGAGGRAPAARCACGRLSERGGGRRPHAARGGAGLGPVGGRRAPRSSARRCWRGCSARPTTAPTSRRCWPTAWRRPLLLLALPKVLYVFVPRQPERARGLLMGEPDPAAHRGGRRSSRLRPPGWAAPRCWRGGSTTRIWPIPFCASTPPTRSSPSRPWRWGAA
jgi:hypothetical protein